MASVYRLNLPDPHNFDKSLAAFGGVLAHFLPPPHRVCLILFTNNRAMIADVVERLGVDVSVFLWKRLTIAEFAACDQLRRIQGARLNAGDFTVSLSRQWGAPDYDWAESRPTKFRVVIEKSFRVGTGDSGKMQEPDPELLDTITSLAHSIPGGEENRRVHTCIGFSKEQIKHCFTLSAPCEYGARLLCLLTPLFECQELLAGFECVGPAEELSGLVEHEGFGFIEGADAPIYLDPLPNRFKLEPDGLSFSVPNSDLTQASEVVRSIGAALRHEGFLGIRRGYLPWQMGDSRRAARTAGNFGCFYVAEGEAAIEIGLEQYGHADVPVRAIRKAFDAYASANGLSLKRAY